MDNYTLLVTLSIILFIDVIFTFIISGSGDTLFLKEWRASYLFLFLGFFLLLMQPYLPPLLTVILGNYFILLGFYFQVFAAITFEYQRIMKKKGLLPVISFLFVGSYLYFTYLNYNTSCRIIIISAFLFLFFGTGLIMLGRTRKKGAPPLKTRELYFLFGISALFYLLRLIFTIQGSGAVKSLYDPNFITTLSLLSVILSSQIYLSGLFHGILRNKIHLANREKEKLGYLFNFLNDTARYLDIEELYGMIEKTLKDSFGVDTAAIFLVDENKKSHSMAYTFNAMELPLDGVRTLKKGEGASGEAIDKDRVVELSLEDYPDKAMAAIYREKGVKKFVSLPLKSAEGILGAITMVYSESHAAQNLDRDFFYYLGEQIGLVLHNAFLYTRLREMAHTDPLTGLHNRRKMLELGQEEIKRVKRNGRNFTIALADLDHFKKINDKFGHELGDEVLIASADLFRKECREYDYVCRWGGEEFLFFLIDSDLSTAHNTAERIRMAFENYSFPGLMGERLTISIGLTRYNRELSLEQSIALADEALYSAKESGRNRIVVK